MKEMPLENKEKIEKWRDRLPSLFEGYGCEEWEDDKSDRENFEKVVIALKKKKVAELKKKQEEAAALKKKQEEEAAASKKKQEEGEDNDDNDDNDDDEEEKEEEKDEENDDDGHEEEKEEEKDEENDDDGNVGGGDVDNDPSEHFVPGDNSPSKVPRAGSDASKGIKLEEALNHLTSIPDSIVDNEEKKSQAKNGLKKIAQKLLRVTDGAPCALIFSFQIYTGDVYSVVNWIDEIKWLLGNKYSGAEPSVYPGTDIADLAIQLANED